MNDFITLDGKVYQYISRKYVNKKQGSSPTRSLDGTLNIDYASIPKVEWTFLFEVDNRQLLRLHNMWLLNAEIAMVDWDSSSYTVATTNEEFAPNFEGEGISTVTIDFKEV